MGNQPSQSRTNPNKRIVHAVNGRSRSQRKSVRMEDEVQVFNTSTKTRSTVNHRRNSVSQTRGSLQNSPNITKSMKLNASPKIQGEAPQEFAIRNQNSLNSQNKNSQNGFIISKSTENMSMRQLQQKDLSFRRPPVNLSKSFDAEVAIKKSKGNRKFESFDNSTEEINEKRKLWWNGIESGVKIQTEKLIKIDAKAKVDHRNDWSPNKKREKRIETFKLEWRARPALNTKENLHHVPGGGNKRYPTENLEWNAKPKIDSGFVYLN